MASTIQQSILAKNTTQGIASRDALRGAKLATPVARRASAKAPKGTTMALTSFQEEICLSPPVQQSVLGVILGGGAGTRLYPLTKMRAKPAVPLGANYRLIDIPVSNCINSNVNKIYCLTQFNSASLNRHLSQAYNANVGSYQNQGFVEVLAAQQSPTNPEWFQGTADAVRQYLWLFNESNAQEYLILSGDHLYRMDYQEFIAKHREVSADITVGAVPMDEERAAAFGLMKIDDTGKIIDFAEKPTGEALKAMEVDTTILGLDEERAKEMPYIASMGIYVFRKEAMDDLLKQHFPTANDFGSEVIPGAKDLGMHVQAFLFDGYWEDIGTIKAFYDSNLNLCTKEPNFSFYDHKAPIYTQSRYLPPSKLMNSQITQSIIGDGCYIESSKVHHSVIGLRSLISAGCTIEDTLLMGADYFEQSIEGSVPIGIGEGSIVKKAIVDKNARIGKNVQIVNAKGVSEANCEDEGYIIKDGIVTIVKDAVIPDGTII
uniref:Glucose-1-phosphate adenylyltransferase n=1 Tax=Pyramimonas obovata TaxID=1411642 RepID=A0A7S0WIY1_9CHLO|eukprot:CAMPEP_0118935110 /NCGR_PEP_ID=MMETSP1169-20130426/14931_1 /TAXON_ID=36882 /ORGANISM="Pyramimonas obovata, Strain CCMP722" /LENGTH=488 /DNA_ID=CAMNT_0006878097 /DNA_START=68 /DNA_END=1534 /DNA_ORIENTATION=+